LGARSTQNPVFQPRRRLLDIKLQRQKRERGFSFGEIAGALRASSGQMLAQLRCFRGIQNAGGK
jgi:hypothetical protein